MTHEVVIDALSQELTIALLEDSKLVEYQRESKDSSYAVGDIYLARVKKLMPGLNAAFIDVGHEKEGFLHYQDLGLQYPVLAKYVKQQVSDRKHLIPMDKVELGSTLPKDDTIDHYLTVGQEILVQVSKEAISTKGPRLTCDISLPGRFMVLVPFQDKVSVSAKIKSSEEKVRLREIVQSLLPKGYGAIVRTSAMGVDAEELSKEVNRLVGRWIDAMTVLQKGKMPSLCYEETGRAVALLRDIFNPSFENIWVNDPATFTQIREYVSLIAPEKANVVHLYDELQPILDHFAVTGQIKSSLGRTVSCKHGAYIIIEHTEAMHVIDVNSGHRSRQSDDQEENALLVDLSAADEIARQMRLRDMGGIVVVDFIDLHNSENRDKLFQHMKELMKEDRAKHNILPLSKFCLMQITRQRVRPVMDIQQAESCPVCGGKHVIKPSLLFPERLEELLDIVVDEKKVSDFRLYLHPFIISHLRSGWFFNSIYWKWRRKYGFKWHLITDQSMELLQYRILDSEGQNIVVNN